MITLAGAATLAQACGGSEPTEETPDATTDPNDASTVDDASVPQPDADAKPPSQKPTDGGLDLDARGPNEYVVQIDNCEEFQGCGGAIDDKRFRYTGACFDQAALQRAMVAYTTCDVVVSNSRALVQGTFELGAGATFEREIGLRFSADVYVPADCQVTQLFGCAVINDYAQGILPGLRCYDTPEGACDCLLNTTQGEVLRGSYEPYGDAGDTLALHVPDGGADGGAAVRLVPYCYEPGITGSLEHTELVEGAETPNSAANVGSYMRWSLTEQSTP